MADKELEYARKLGFAMGPIKVAADELVQAIKLKDEPAVAMAGLTRAKGALKSAAELIDGAFELLR